MRWLDRDCLGWLSGGKISRMETAMSLALAAVLLIRDSEVALRVVQNLSSTVTEPGTC